MRTPRPSASWIDLVAISLLTTFSQLTTLFGGKAFPGESRRRGGPMAEALDDLFEEAMVIWRQRQWRRDNPYVADLIEIMWPHGDIGLSRRNIIDALERSRCDKGLPVPDTFEQTVQSAFNQHCMQSAVFKKRGVPTDGLFSSRRDGTSAIWAVYRERAKAWLIAQNRN